MLKMECVNGVLRVSNETIREAIAERTKTFAKMEADMLEAMINAYKLELGKLLLHEAWTKQCIEMAEWELNRKEMAKS